MKRLTYIFLATVVALALLEGCGLRGDLKRPEPILEPEKKVETTTRTVTTRTVATGPRRNAQGGIIPDAAPTTPVSEGGLGDIP